MAATGEQVSLPLGATVREQQLSKDASTATERSVEAISVATCSTAIAGVEASRPDEEHSKQDCASQAKQDAERPQKPEDLKEKWRQAEETRKVDHAR